MRRSRRYVLSAAALGLALAASGCTYMSPVQTKDFYQAADGTNANIEQDGALYAGVRNAVLVVGADGAATFSATVANYSDEEISVELTGLEEGSTLFSATVQVPAHETLEIGHSGAEQEIPVSTVSAHAGAILDLEVVAAGQATTVSLPVLDDSLEYYQSEEPAAG